MCIGGIAGLELRGQHIGGTQGPHRAVRGRIVAPVHVGGAADKATSAEFVVFETVQIGVHPLGRLAFAKVDKGFHGAPRMSVRKTESDITFCFGRMQGPGGAGFAGDDESAVCASDAGVWLAAVRAPAPISPHLVGDERAHAHQNHDGTTRSGRAILAGWSGRCSRLRWLLRVGERNGLARRCLVAHVAISYRCRRSAWRRPPSIARVAVMLRADGGRLRFATIDAGQRWCPGPDGSDTPTLLRAVTPSLPRLGEPIRLPRCASVPAHRASSGLWARSRVSAPGSRAC